MINNIKKYLNSNDEYKMNQEHIRFKVLFHSYIIKVEKGSNFKDNKYHKCNRLLVKFYMEYYYKYQINRNKWLHNKELQRKRVLEQYEKERNGVMNGPYNQARKYV